MNERKRSSLAHLETAREELLEASKCEWQDNEVYEHHIKMGLLIVMYVINHIEKDEKKRKARQEGRTPLPEKKK